MLTEIEARKLRVDYFVILSDLTAVHIYDEINRFKAMKNIDNSINVQFIKIYRLRAKKTASKCRPIKLDLKEQHLGGTILFNNNN